MTSASEANVDPRKAEPLTRAIDIVGYDPAWPEAFAAEAERIGKALGEAALAIEHTGSTAVPGLAAKPVIDILVSVADPAREEAYVPPLEAAGYRFIFREPDWHEHRLLKGENPEVNLHVFAHGSSEIERVLLFRDWLREDPRDRVLYETTKRGLAHLHWAHIQDYAEAKSEVIGEILVRAQAWRDAHRASS